MKNLSNKLFTILTGWLFVFGSVFLIIFIIKLIPSKLIFIDKPDMPQKFKKLAEFKDYSSFFVAKYNNLNRIDVLFKNQALESNEELKVQIFDDKNNLIFEQNYDSGNFGDTNRVRMDFKLITDSQDKRFKILITPLKIVDWKMYFGVKDDDIDLIQYFGNKFNLKDTIINSFNLMNNKVLLLPIITVTLFLW